MKYIHIVCSIFLFSILLYSCQTEIDKFDGDSFLAQGDYADALAHVQNRDHSLIADASEAHTVLSDGLHIAIPADAWMTSNSDVVNGAYELHVRLISTANECIKYNVQTVDVDDAILEAGVAFHITASQANEPLSLKPAKELVITIETDTQITGLYQSESGKTWTDTERSATSGEYEIEYNGEMSRISGLQFDISNTGWHATMKPSQVVGYRSICLELEDSNVPDNTLALFIPTQTMTCIELNVSDKVQCADTPIPADVGGKVVVIAHQGEQNDKEVIQFVDGNVQVTLEDIDIDLVPNFVTAEGLLNSIEGLNL